MTHITFAPDRDLDWIERITPALHANVNEMYAALEFIATGKTPSPERDHARATLSRIFAWRAPVEQDIPQEI